MSLDRRDPLQVLSSGLGSLVPAPMANGVVRVKLVDVPVVRGHAAVTGGARDPSEMAGEWRSIAGVMIVYLNVYHGEFNENRWLSMMDQTYQ